MDKLVALLGTPLFALLCALIFAGLAAGGKFSVLMSQILFVLAAAVAILCFRIFEWPVALGLDLLAAGLLVLLAWWARPDTLPSYSGTLVAPNVSVLLSGKDHTVARQLEIGDSGSILTFVGPPDMPLFNFFRARSFACGIN